MKLEWGGMAGIVVMASFSSISSTIEERSWRGHFLYRFDYGGDAQDNLEYKTRWEDN